MAKVVENNSSNQTIISDLPFGTIFKYNGKWYIRCFCYNDVVVSFNETRKYPEEHCGMNLETGELELPLTLCNASYPEAIAKEVIIDF